MQEQPAKKEAFLQFLETAKFLKYFKGQRNELCNQKREKIDFQGPANTVYSAYLKAVNSRKGQEGTEEIPLTPLERKLLEVEKKRLPSETRDILFYLLKKGTTLQREAAKYAKVSSSTTAIIVKQLLALEIITKDHGDEAFGDGHIELTEFGILVATKYSEDADFLGTNIFEGFSDDELKTFSKLMTKVHANTIRKIYEMKK